MTTTVTLISLQISKDSEPYNGPIPVLVDAIIAECSASPVDFFNTGTDGGEVSYIAAMRDAYIRTLQGLVTRYPDSKKRIAIRVLEIGSFFGIVSICIAKLGFDVTAQDITEFIDCEKIQYRYKMHGVKWVTANLKDYSLPFANSNFDLVIMCEVIEHLNFNPLPVFTEINRILSPFGLLYCATPNQASLSKRMNFLAGRSINHPMSYFLSQLRAENGMIVGIHWREYTNPELLELFTLCGFRVIESRFHRFDNVESPNLVRRLFLRIIYRVFPKLHAFQTVLGEKTEAPETESFRFTASSRP